MNPYVNPYAMTAQERWDYIGQLCDEITIGLTKPDLKPLTASQMFLHARQIREMSNLIRMTGGNVKPEYEPIDFTEEIEDEL